MSPVVRTLLSAALLALLGVLLPGLAGIWLDHAVGRWVAKAKAQEMTRHEVAALVTELQTIGTAGKTQPGHAEAEPIASLLPWLEKEMAALKLSDRMQQISPVAVKDADAKVYREKAELHLKALDMEKVIRLLDRLESVPGIRVTRGDIRRAENNLPGVMLSCEVGLLLP
ncbi:MAG: hypothetical protein HQL66_09475 [Magnetococcales bacterium]|nr:hypothetical protein [Magnetococcales bacterium]